MGKTYKPTWKTFFELGKEDFYRSNYNSSISYFNLALINNPRSTHIYCLIYIYLAASNYYLGFHMPSINYFRNGLIRDDIFKRLPLWLLIDYLNEKEDIKELKNLNNLLKLFIKLFAKYDQKYISLEEVLNIYWMQGYMYRFYNQTRWSLEYYSKAISILNNDYFEKKQKNAFLMSLLATRASTYRNKGRYVEAINDINNSILLVERKFQWYFPYLNAAVIYKKLGIYNISISMLSKAIDSFHYIIPLDRHYVFAYINRGFLRSKIGNIEDAINDFELAFFKNKNCFKDFRKTIDKIPEEIKNIFSIHFDIKI